MALGVSRGKLLIVGSLAALAVVAVLLLWPREVAPEEQVRRNVVKMARAAEAKELGGITEHISESFKGAGGVDKNGVKGILLREVFRGTWTRVFVVGMETRAVSPDEVAFQGRFIFGRSDAKELKDLAKNSEMEAFVIEATARRESDGELRFTTATYRRAAPTELLP